MNKNLIFGLSTLLIFAHPAQAGAQNGKTLEDLTPKIEKHQAEAQRLKNKAYNHSDIATDFTFTINQKIMRVPESERAAVIGANEKAATSNQEAAAAHSDAVQFLKTMKNQHADGSPLTPDEAATKKVHETLVKDLTTQAKEDSHAAAIPTREAAKKATMGRYQGRAGSVINYGR